MTQAYHILYVPRPARLIEIVRSRVRSLDIEIDELREVLGQYGLEIIRQPRNLSASRRNHNVAVDTPVGRKLLKRYRPQWQIETVMYGHSIMDRLAELSFPVPRLATALDGETFISRAGHLYAVLDFVEGTNFSANFLPRAHRRKLMALAGQTLAQLHRALEGFIPQGRHHIGFEAYTGKRRRDLAWHIEKVNDLRDKSRRLANPEDQQHADWLIRNCGYIVDQLGPLDELLRAAPLKRVIIHGDYGLHNLLFRRDGTVTPVDFELARLEWRLSDLVSCLSRFRYGEGMYDFESIQWFMEAYHTEFPLSADEWRLFPQVWRFYKLQGAVQYWNSYFETKGPARKLISARDAIAQADWVSNHPEHLLAQLQGQRPRMSLARM